MTNFDFLTTEPKFESFADVAVSAERVLKIDPSSCVLNCRRAMEFAVKRGSKSVLTGELKNKIDSLREIFWTGGLTNPLDVIEQIPI